MSATRYLEIVFAAAGLSLSISGALTTWVKGSISASGSFMGQTISSSQNLAVGPLASNSGNGLTYSNQSAQLTAGASMLLIGFIVGVFHFVNAILLARGFTGTTLVSKPIATLAFVCTLIGTIVSGAGNDAVNVTNLQKMVNEVVGGLAGSLPTGVSLTSSTSWDAGFGLAIAATITQFIALLLAIVAPAPASAASDNKPAEATPAAVVVRETA